MNDNTRSKKLVGILIAITLPPLLMFLYTTMGQQQAESSVREASCTCPTTNPVPSRSTEGDRREQAPTLTPAPSLVDETSKQIEINHSEEPATAEITAPPEDHSPTAARIWPDLSYAAITTESFFYDLVRSPQIEDPTKHWVVEAGSFDGTQLKPALNRSYNIMIFEPSGKNYNKVNATITQYCHRVPSGCKGKIINHRKAASSHAHTVVFAGIGDTGDHVVRSDGKIALGQEGRHNSSHSDSVEAVPMDDMVAPLGKAYVIKIDVQDHEPAVLQGMTKILAQGLADFIILEYRPQGWAHMFPETTPVKELTRVCGSPKFTCYYTGRMTLFSFKRKTRYPQFFFGWASMTPEGNGWPIPLFNYKLWRAAPVNDTFGSWTDIIAINNESPLASSVLSNIFSLRCPRRFAQVAGRCRPARR